MKYDHVSVLALHCVGEEVRYSLPCLVALVQLSRHTGNREYPWLFEEGAEGRREAEELKRLYP